MIAYYVLLISISLALGIGGLLLFLWCFRTRQFEDLDGAAERILFDEVEPIGDRPKTLERRSTKECN